MTARLSRDEIDAFARAKFGEPNLRESRRDELQFGTRGSKRANLVTAKWEDFETGEEGSFLPPLPTPADLWAGAHPLFRGMLGWTYWVETRCCCVYPGLELRQHPALYYEPEKREMAGLVAAVRDAGNRFIAISRTFLAPDGRKLGRRFLGKVGGGHVVVHNPGKYAAPGHLIVAEGLESAAGAAAEHPECIAWSALSAGGVRGLALPHGIMRLIIAPDMDVAGTGQRAAAVLAARARDRGIKVDILMPDPPHVDLNDAHRASREAVEW